MCLLLGFLFMSGQACSYVAHGYDTTVADSLNLLSYQSRYKNLEQCEYYARQALEQAGEETLAAAVACNNLAFYYFMKMDFDSSRKYLMLVYECCNNELERLVADVGMMKICQCTSDNKSFYTYRQQALKRIRRVSEEFQTLNKSERERYLYAKSEYHIVSGIYFNYLQQFPQALEEMDAVQAMETDLVADTVQTLYYYYIKGSGGMCRGNELRDITLQEFDCLSRCFGESQYHIYFKYSCLQAIAEILIHPEKRKILYEERAQMLKVINVDNLPDSLLPMQLARRALAYFRQYGDIYQTVASYCTIGSCLIARTHYEEAIDSLQRALDCVNHHHALYYTCHDPEHRLQTYVLNDTTNLELQWMSSANVQTVPEWIAGIREQLSMAYSGLGMKSESDYNRNIYLDILDITRQDKELESRYETLQHEQMQLNQFLAVTITMLLILIVLFAALNSCWRKNNTVQIQKLKRALEWCHLLPNKLSDSILDKNQITAEFLATIRSGEKPMKNKVYSKDEAILLEVIQPYLDWTIENARYFQSLDEKRLCIEKEKYILEQHIAENKRQNIVKKACFSIVLGIAPYMDRIINELHKLVSIYDDKYLELRKAKYQYIEELVTRINEYNDILSLWIKVRQGELSLNIQNFELEELFAILSKGRRTFENKGLDFVIIPTKAVVKADKALTLFMINTLAENARKYTSSGGRVEIKACEEDTYVEISVTDTGRGLSSDDVAHILEDKVYDSEKIGLQGDETDKALKQEKGSGFGLMNCKGIIEKYRKTSDLFNVCLFGIQSQLGKGSRFYFRLPKGTLRRTLLQMISGLIVLMGLVSCQKNDVTEQVEVTDETFYYDEALEQASRLADSVYYCNVYREHQQALLYADSALYYLNSHVTDYLQIQHLPLMKLVDDETVDIAELIWWRENINTDYHVVLDLRNEVAVAYLALKQWEAYKYNNAIYTSLYKLLSYDSSLEPYCRDIERSSINKKVSIVLCIFFVVLFLSSYYVLYFRRRTLYRFHLEQVLEINKQLSESSMESTRDNSDRIKILTSGLQHAFEAMNELVELQVWGVGIWQENDKKITFYNYPQIPLYEGLDSAVRRCQTEAHQVCSDQGRVLCLPLEDAWNEETNQPGVFFLQGKDNFTQEEVLLIELVTRYVNTWVVNSVVKINQSYRTLEAVGDDKFRARREENMLHVQNMVLDNCLSTIKHETLYYPNKIKQIIMYLQEEISMPEERELVKTMNELMSYYKSIYTILSSCAARQLDDITFRRQTIAVKDLADYAQKYMRRVKKKTACQIELQVDLCDGHVIGDKVLLEYLFENLINEAISYEKDGLLILHIISEKEFMRFELKDTRRHYSQEELDNLFNPDLRRMYSTTNGKLMGSEYLICKQILREHDEYTGRRGCRMNAEMLSDGGFVLWFTIPCKK